jgi:hypothetical protein
MSITPVRSRRFAALACASVTIGVLALAGPVAAKPAQPRESQTYIGTVRGTNAFAVIVARRGVAIAYVCDGDKIAVWLKGKFRNGKLHLASKAGDTLEGTFGRATLDLTTRRPLTVKTRFSPFNDAAHFFIAGGTVNGTSWAGGWITLLDGRQRGAVRTPRGTVTPSPIKVTTTTTSVALPGGGTLGVNDYLKCWDCLPATAGGAAT